MSQTATQADRIFLHLKAGKEITPIDALNLYGCFRLGARIYDLRQQGHRITRRMVTENGKTFAAYRMEQAKKDNQVMAQKMPEPVFS